MATPLLVGFPPVVDDRASVLILARFPASNHWPLGTTTGIREMPFGKSPVSFSASTEPRRTNCGSRCCNPGAWHCGTCCTAAAGGQRGFRDRPKKLGGQRFWRATHRVSGHCSGCTSTAVRRPSCSAGWPQTAWTGRLEYRRLPSTQPGPRRAARRKAGRVARDCPGSAPIRLAMTPAVGGCAHGRAASICADSDSSVASSYGRPTS